MAADQKDDQRVFQAKQRELLMGVKDLSKHAILADAGDLEDQLERGDIAFLLTTRPSIHHILPLHHPLRRQLTHSSPLSSPSSTLLTLAGLKKQKTMPSSISVAVPASAHKDDSASKGGSITPGKKKKSSGGGGSEKKRKL
jgi:hypothetical protein